MPPYTGNSVVDYLKSTGGDSSFANRQKLATQQGITGYTGSAEQNTSLLGKLNQPVQSPVQQNTQNTAPAYYNQPSSTTLSNVNKVNQVPGMVNTLDKMSQRGTMTDTTSGLASYADGSPAELPEVAQARKDALANVQKQKDEALKRQQDLANGVTTKVTTPVKSDLELESEKVALQQDQMLADMKSNLDSETKALIDNIQQNFQRKREEQNKINEKQNKGLQAGLLTGGVTGQGSRAQYTSQGSATNIMAAQENYALDNIKKIDEDERSAIAAAKAAQASGNFKILGQQLALAESRHNEKVAAAAKLNEKIAADNAKLQERNMQADRDESIASLYEQGVTDVPSILSQLNKAGGNFTSKEVKETLDNLIPPGIDELVKTLRTNGAPQEVVQKVLKSTNINDAYNNAGNWSAGGTGIVGEYNLYKAQAMQAGQVPMSFNAYQDVDANRKKSIARAGASTSTGSGGAPGKAYGSDLDAFLDNVTNTIPTKFGQETYRQSLGKARTDADKIRTAASVVLKNSPATVKEAFANQAVGMKEIDKAIALLDEGAKTGVLQAGQQYIFNQAGKDFDPKLAAINAHIIGAIQPYRNIVTGAAWATQEDNEYANLFGSTKYSPKELKERLLRVKDIMQEKSVQGLSSQVDPFGTGTNFFETQSTMNKNLVGTEDQAKQTIFNYGKTNPTFQPIITKKVNEINPFTKQKYTYSELLQIYPEIK